MHVLDMLLSLVNSHQKSFETTQMCNLPYFIVHHIVMLPIDSFLKATLLHDSKVILHYYCMTIYCTKHKEQSNPFYENIEQKNRSERERE